MLPLRGRSSGLVLVESFLHDGGQVLSGEARVIASELARVLGAGSSLVGISTLFLFQNFWHEVVPAKGLLLARQIIKFKSMKDIVE